MPDFKALLSKPTNEIEKPKPIPTGTYYGLVKDYILGESREKKTPYVRFNLLTQEAGADVDRDLLAGIDLSKKALWRDFYLTEDALYRLKEFLVSIGISDGNGTRTIGEMLPEATSRQVMYSVTQTQGTGNNSDQVYNNIDSIAARPD